jgi:hypothetical protein
LALAVQIPGKNETDRNAHHLLFRRERKKVKKNKRIKENDGKKKVGGGTRRTERGYYRNCWTGGLLTRKSVRIFG